MSILYPFDRATVEWFAKGPPEGGTHRWIFTAAAKLRHLFSQDSCYTYLRKVVDAYVLHRPIPDREIMDAVNRVYESQSDFPTLRASIDWPDRKENIIKVALEEHAPICNLEEKITAKEALPQLFWADELVCYGPSKFSAAVTDPVNLSHFAEKMQFIVANPARALTGKTKDGKDSARCQANVAFRRYLVTEFDHMPDKADQARLLTLLAKLRHLVMVVDSGSKSLHGWFEAEGAREGDCILFYGMAIMLGADPTRWDIGGWVRMPGGVRDNGKRQNIVYWRGRP